MHLPAALQLLLRLTSLLQLLRLAVSFPSSTTTGGNNASCAPARCGDLTITYPFSLGGAQPFECGYPAFNLTCDAAAGRAYLSRTSRERLFRVQDIFYDNSSFVVAVENAAAGDDRCPVPDFNVSSSLALFPVLISTTDNTKLNFVYNCNFPPGMRLPDEACANRTIGAYFSDSAEARNVPANCSSVSMPVLAFQEKRLPSRDYVQMIGDGFLLEWPDQGDCGACKRRGGECRFLGSFQCLCDDRPCSRNFFLSDIMMKQSVKIILIVSLSAATSLILTTIFWIRHRRKEKQNVFIQNQRYKGNELKVKELLKGYDSLSLKTYKYSELRKITGSFKEKLGEGGYGMVFKGKLEDGRMVAVKILKGSKGNGEEFLNEVVSIRRTSHVNVVTLLGFCLHGSKRALVYEYMANGSLDKYIYSEDSKMAIGWEKLQHIAIGVARGLEYLHRGCNTRIIHFDIKPHNVLLDEDFSPKIADFGLAKLCRLKDSVLSIAEGRGTIGFIAPEVFSRGFGVVSTKSDVYSYGMMLLEMVGGRTNINENTENSSEAYFPNWIYDRLLKDLKSHEIVCETEEIARKMTLVGLWCIQTSPVNRPSMSRVVEMLEKSIGELEMPPKPFLSCPSPPHNYSS